jgi:membrane protein YdbS with pleckstrin-like domain
MKKINNSFLQILSIALVFIAAIAVASLLIIVIAHQSWYYVLILLCLCIGLANIDIYFEQRLRNKKK